MADSGEHEPLGTLPNLPPVMCHLCEQFGDTAEADLYATVPMCGHYPRYPLCLGCYEDIASECQDVRLIEDSR